MADHEPTSPIDARHDGTYLPVPAGNRLPAERPSAAVAVERAAGLVRAVAGAPLVAAAVAGATAAVAASGAAAASRLLSPWTWVRRPPASEDAQPAAAEWAGPGVHVSYTHIEIHWRTGR
jgi:hypothetical protein